MANYQDAARQAARRYGLDEGVFLRQIRQESGFNPHARSPAGAIGIAQIMPATARGWGVDPTDPIASLNAAAKNMAGYVKKYGSYKNALVAYNAGPGAVGGRLPAETQNYLKVILGGRNPGTSSVRSGGGTTTTTTTSGSTSLPDFGQQASQLPLIEALTQSQRSGPPAADIQAPSFTAHPVLPEGFGTVSGGGGPSPGPDLGSLAAAIKTLGGDIPATQQQTTPGSSSTSTSGTAGFSTPKGQSGVAKFEGKPVAAWIAPALQYARAHGWKGQVNSGYRSFAEQQRIYNSGVRPAAKPGTSNHEGTQFPRGAIDVSDAVTLSKILERSPYARRLVWAGSKDPVHFSHPHGGHY